MKVSTSVRVVGSVCAHMTRFCFAFCFANLIFLPALRVLVSITQPSEALFILSSATFTLVRSLLIPVHIPRRGVVFAGVRCG